MKTMFEMVDIFNSGTQKKYRKFGTVKAKYAVESKVYDTVINGIVETTNTAKAGDVLVTNPGGEQYLVNLEKFKDRYNGPDMKNIDQSYEACGECFGIQYQGDKLSFMAEWGETMIIESGDMLVSTEMPANNVYRIEKNAFKDTYKEVL